MSNCCPLNSRHHSSDQYSREYISGVRAHLTNNSTNTTASDHYQTPSYGELYTSPMTPNFLDLSPTQIRLVKVCFLVQLVAGIITIISSLACIQSECYGDFLGIGLWTGSVYALSAIFTYTSWRWFGQSTCIVGLSTVLGFVTLLFALLEMGMHFVGISMEVQLRATYSMVEQSVQQSKALGGMSIFLESRWRLFRHHIVVHVTSVTAALVNLVANVIQCKALADRFTVLSEHPGRPNLGDSGAQKKENFALVFANKNVISDQEDPHMDQQNFFFPTTESQLSPSLRVTRLPSTSKIQKSAATSNIYDTTSDDQAMIALETLSPPAYTSRSIQTAVSDKMATTATFSHPLARPTAFPTGSPEMSTPRVVLSRKTVDFDVKPAASPPQSILLRKLPHKAPAAMGNTSIPSSAIFNANGDNYPHHLSHNTSDSIIFPSDQYSSPTFPRLVVSLDNSNHCSSWTYSHNYNSSKPIMSSAGYKNTKIKLAEKECSTVSTNSIRESPKSPRSRPHVVGGGSMSPYLTYKSANSRGSLCIHNSQATSILYQDL